MIIRPAGERLHFITQPDHARLSRKVMEACVPLTTHPRRAQILHATGEHDNGWTEPDAAPLVDLVTGHPFDFVSAPPAVRQGVWPRAVQRLADDPWAAALVAQHAIAVYDRYASDPQWTAFFARMTRLRDEMVRASGEDPSALPGDYAFVRLGDLTSLAFCTGWADLGSGHWTVTCSGARVHVSPDPFGGAVIPLEVQAKELTPRTYASHSELREAFAGARMVVLGGTAAGRPDCAST